MPTKILFFTDLKAVSAETGPMILIFFFLKNLTTG